MTHRERRVRRLSPAIAALALAGAAACSQPREEGAEIVARIGDREVTLQEIDDQWRAANPAQHAQVTQATYDARRRVLEGMIAETLIAGAAREAGQSTSDFEEAEITRRSAPVTAADVEAFYNANPAQMQGRSLEVMRPAIEEYLRNERRAAARHALLAELQPGGPPVAVSLEPPRSTVALRADDPAIGSESAPVTLVEFSDFECPYCRQVAPTLRRLRDAYGDQLRIVWKDFPLTQIHPGAFKAAEAAHCAGDQGRYWEYHDQLFAGPQPIAPERLTEVALGLDLDAAAFDACLGSSQHAARVREGMTQGTSLGVGSTPTIFINGRMLSGAQPYETFVAVVEEELARAR